MNNTIKKIGIGIATAAITISSFAMPALAVTSPAFGLDPFTFVGSAADCAPSPAGTNTVTAKWDSTTGNPTPSILLQKLGATSNCAAAGVDITTSLEGGAISGITELNFDYKDGEHCGAGSPRFNIVSGNKVAFLGCSGGTASAPVNGWVHVVFTQAQITAALTTATILPTDTLDDLYIIFDEGEDTPTGGTIGTAGTVHIDNISVNTGVVGSPTSPQSKDDCKKDGYKKFTGVNNTAGPFKNQGQCVSYFNHFNR